MCFSSVRFDSHPFISQSILSFSSSSSRELSLSPILSRAAAIFSFVNDGDCPEKYNEKYNAARFDINRKWLAAEEEKKVSRQWDYTRHISSNTFVEFIIVIFVARSAPGTEKLYHLALQASARVLFYIPL
jgi:hypothetical protein